MKQCPQCGRIYPDSTQYCGTDGSLLVASPTDAIDDSRWRAKSDGETHPQTPPPPDPVVVPDAVSVTDADAPPPSFRSSHAKRRGARPAPIALIAGAVIVFAGLWWLWAHPTVEVINRLATTASVTLPSRDVVALAPGATHSVRLTRRERAMRWEVAPNRSVTPAAAAIDRTARIAFPSWPLARARVELVADADRDRFVAPLITNRTSGDLCILVNRVEGSTGPRCDARVPTGSRGIFIGYYPLGSNSSVRALRLDGAGATYPAIAGQVRRGSGAVPLSFSDRDFGVR
ncbi:MAG: hypothetical protein ABIR59_02475 [Gemmatimonadales bacterium]